MPKKYILKLINPDLIKPDKTNPRGDAPEVIESDPEFIRLKDSVYEFGVLVPLIVRKDAKDEGKYILIDGERRLRAAWATNLKEVPVHIVRETSSDHLITAFQIHMLRKQWPKVAQARSLRMIVNSITKEKPEITKSDLFEIIQDKTGYTDSLLKDLLRILNYSNTILNEIEGGNSLLKISHLVQIEASLIEPLEKQFKDLLQELGKEYIREKLINKIRNGAIYSTRDLMENVYPLYLRAKSEDQKEFLHDNLKKFIKDEEMGSSKLTKNFEAKFPSNIGDLKNTLSDIDEKIEQVKNLIVCMDISELKSYSPLKNELKSKLKSFFKFLEDILKKLR